MSCGAVATLCGGCLPPMLKNLNFSVIKNLFEEAREMAAKGEVHFGIKVYENEAEIQQALAGNLQQWVLIGTSKAAQVQSRMIIGG